MKRKSEAEIQKLWNLIQRSKKFYGLRSLRKIDHGLGFKYERGEQKFQVTLIYARESGWAYNFHNFTEGIYRFTVILDCDTERAFRKIEQKIVAEAW